MINILDLDDVMMGGKAEIESVMEEAEREFYAPLGDMQIAEMWQKMSPEIKLLLRQENKAAVEKLEKKLGG